MHRRIKRFPFDLSEIEELKDKMLNWTSRFGISLFLDSNSYADKYGKYECLLGAGSVSTITVNAGDAFGQLQEFYEVHKDWLFGQLSYDLKNLLEPHLRSRHPAKHGFPLLEFFVPEVVCYIPRGATELCIETSNVDPDLVMEQIHSCASDTMQTLSTVKLAPRIEKDEYIQRIVALKEHIRNGDCYEITFCNEAFADDVSIDTRSLFKRLNAVSPAPFAAHYQSGDRSMVCASPERFIQKEGSTVRSQPIKGTSRRGAGDEEDRMLKSELYNSEKERAENVMIVDLVRNDLARTCGLGTVVVDELFGIYTYPQVHQMISTISGQLREGVALTEAIRFAFPMGSMTGAPKHKVMRLIEEYESARRELFSGSVGYISPAGDFDFNVIIRSLFYNASKGYLSYQTGGAITWDSDPQSEWEEMRLKAQALESIFIAK